MKRRQSSPTSPQFAQKILATTRSAVRTQALKRGFVVLEFADSGEIKVAAHLQYNGNWQGQSNQFTYGDLVEVAE